MNLDFLKKIRIKAKIFSGFGALIALLALIAVIGTWGLTSVRGGFGEFRYAAHETNEAGHVQSALLNTRINVRNFVIKPNDENAAAVRKSAQSTLAQVAELEKLLTTDEHRAASAAALKDVKAYMAAFEEVTQQQVEIDTLVDGTLHKAGVEMEKLLTYIMEVSARDQEAETAFAGGKTMRSMLLQQLYVAKFLDDNTEASAKRAREEAGRTDKELNDLITRVENTIFLKQAKQVRVYQNQYAATFAEVYKLIVARNAIITGTLDKIGPRVAAAVEAFKADFRKQQDVLGADADSKTSFTIMMMLVAAGVSLLLGAAAAWLIGTGIAGPVGAITGAMNRLAKGDRTVEIPHTDHTDEVGDMASALAIFRDNLVETERLQAEQAVAEKRVVEEERQREAEKQEAERKEMEAREKAAEDERKRAEKLNTLIAAFDAEVSRVIESLSRSAGEMEASAQAMSSTAEETSRQSATVASASEQATANVQSVASAAEELAATVAEVGRRIEESAGIARNAVDEVENTNVKVQGLAEAASKIGEVVNLINDIASQTNLLALNATIEAARAGEAGKGFAVVASEVKSLANQTAKATEEIAGQIGAIQGATGDAVTAIGSIGATIGKVHEIASSIASAVEEQNAATSEIAANVNEVAGGTQDISSNIAGISTAAQETGSAASQVLSAAKSLSVQSADLKTAVDAFLTNVRAA